MAGAVWGLKLSVRDLEHFVAFYQRLLRWTESRRISLDEQGGLEARLDTPDGAAGLCLVRLSRAA